MNNPNPVVLQGTCRVCGRPVSLFEADALEYLKEPHRGLIHIFICPDEEEWKEEREKREDGPR